MVAPTRSWPNNRERPPEIRLTLMFGYYTFSARGDVRDDTFEAFLCWCDDRKIKMHAYHDFEKPYRQYDSDAISDDLAMEIRMSWDFVTLQNRGGW
ncbi:MAG: hypothetical protein EOO77_38520 [Oxalobacteraceae bacterium]|nr:MAG: hypothetical protein EOO77_38520 [Oxalobacteraceae bacterium]